MDIQESEIPSSHYIPFCFEEGIYKILRNSAGCEKVMEEMFSICEQEELNNHIIPGDFIIYDSPSSPLP